MKLKDETFAVISCILLSVLAGVGVVRGWDPAIVVGCFVTAEINWAVAVILSALRGKS